MTTTVIKLFFLLGLIGMLLAIILAFAYDIARATSTIYFSGDGFSIEATVSDTETEVANIRVYREHRLVFSAGPGDYQEAFCDPERQVIAVVVAEKQHHPRFELSGRGEKVTMVLGQEKAHLDADWAR
jgi:hypothetical protein